MFYNPLQIPGVEGTSFCGGYYNHRLVRTPDGWRSERLVGRQPVVREQPVRQRVN